MGEFRLGAPMPLGDPFARRVISRMICPFCGEADLLPGRREDYFDGGRIQLACDNEACSVDQFVVLALMSGGAPLDRADVAALGAIEEFDDGRESEDRRKSPARVTITLS